MTALVEISKKRLTEEEKRHRTQARVGLASNVIGLTAGTAALVGAAKSPALRKKVGSVIPASEPKKISRWVKAGAIGGLGLQAANMGGDVVANRVLARSAGTGEKKKVAKAGGKAAGAAGATAAAGAAGAAALKHIGEGARAGVAAQKKGRRWLVPVVVGGGVATGGGAALAASRRKKDIEKSDGEWMLDAYISKADHTRGSGKNLLSDEDYNRELADAKREIKPALQRRGAAVGAVYGGTLGSLAMLHPSALKSGKRMIGAGVAGTAGGAALGAVGGRALGSRAWNKGEKQLRENPKTRRAAEQRILIRRHNEREMDKWARNQSKKVEKAYRRYDPEADRQRRLGLAAGAGVGGAALLGGQAARQYTTKLKHLDDTPTRGIAVRPKRGKAAILYTGGALASGGLGAYAYRRGLSERNNPWN